MWSNVGTPEVDRDRPGERFSPRLTRTDGPADQEGRPVTLPVSSVLPGGSPRLAGENLEHIQLLAATRDLAPILVHRSTMRVIDGMHRLRAARLRGDDTISVQFFDGDEGEAFLLSVRANIKHGLPLSLADREAAASRILLLYRQWSDRAVAAAAGLSPTTVSRLRQRLSLPVEQQASRVGRDGRVRPLDGAVGRRRASAVIAMKPDAPLRVIAEQAGVSLGTARDVRERLRAGQDPVLAPQRGATERSEPPVDDPVQSPRRTTVGAQPGVDWPSLRGNLSRDPAVKYTESGRAVFRWLDGHVIEPAEWREVIDAVPPHWRATVADVVRSCAGEWLAFARELEDRA